jgi:hypothetical protein
MGQRGDPKTDRTDSEPEPVPDSDTLSPVPELIRRAAALGLSGFFMTEGALRKALGDTVPKDWVDFAAQQGERTRNDLMERLGDEMARVIRNVDLVEMLDQLLTGRTIEVEAKFRLGAPTDDEGADASRPVDIRIKTG